jgi:hypothetical protein
MGFLLWQSRNWLTLLIKIYTLYGILEMQVLNYGQYHFYLFLYSDFMDVIYYYHWKCWCDKHWYVWMHTRVLIYWKLLSLENVDGGNIW